MAYVSKQLIFKFASIVVASLVTFASLLMSMDMLRQMPTKDTSNPRSHSSTTKFHLDYQMEKYQGCHDCVYRHYSGASGACCKKQHNRKWGPLAPPASQLLDDYNYDLKLRMTPAAQRNHPFLRRTPNIDYSHQSNSTNYVYLFPDPILAPEQAPEPAVELPPLFWDDYQHPYDAPWESPQITLYPPLTDYSYEGDIEPPIA